MGAVGLLVTVVGLAVALGFTVTFSLTVTASFAVTFSLAVTVDSVLIGGFVFGLFIFFRTVSLLVVAEREAKTSTKTSPRVK